MNRPWTVFPTLITVMTIAGFGLIPNTGRAEDTVPAEKSAEAVPATPRFNIWEYRVEGNSLLPETDIERVLYPYLGGQRGVEDVEAARKKLEQHYRDAGYPTVLVNLPEQKVRDGVVRLRVVEGRIERLRVTGARYFSVARIREEVPALTADAVPNLPRVQDQLAALNRESTDRNIIPVLRPGRTPGTVEVELKVKDQLPVHGDVDLNNRYTEGTTHTRLNASLRYDNLWQRAHSLSLQVQTSPENTDEVKALSGTYLVHLPGSDNLLAVYGVSSKSNIATLGALNVIGNGHILGLREIVPLATNGQYSHNLSFGVDRKNFKETILLGADQVNTPIAYNSFSLLYSGSQSSDTGSTRFGIGPTFGLRGLGNDEQEFAAKRFGARANFFYLRGNIAGTHKWPRGSSLTARLDAQWSSAPLISNEQMSAGGAESVRGYAEAQQLGDYGAQGTLELRSPYLGPKDAKALQDLRALWFVDTAKLRVREATNGQDDTFVLLSSGIGLRMTAWQRLEFSLDWAEALKNSGTVRDGDTRWHGRVAYSF
jgi:hemolysin activation/secretion protein